MQETPISQWKNFPWNYIFKFYCHGGAYSFNLIQQVEFNLSIKDLQHAHGELTHILVPFLGWTREYKQKPAPISVLLSFIRLIL
jgi:hypothetical protein